MTGPRRGRFVRLVLAALALVPALAGAAAETAPAAPPARPRIGLVLSGGGARGLAHIGVLRVLREQRIPVDVVAATSMGAIVGGAYAAGLPVDEIEGALGAMAWDDVLAGRAPRQDQHWRRKADDGRNLSRLEFGVRASGLGLPSGALADGEIESFLQRLTASLPEVASLRQLPVPFVAMATDLETGEAVELDDVPLGLAMRASMSVPGAFAPVPSQGRLLVDGGLVANLPVEAARRLGAEIVIAVNVGTPRAPRAELDSALRVAQQMVNILTEKSVEAAKLALRPGDVLVQPEFGPTGAADFAKARQIIALGERAARAALAPLRALALDEEAYAAHEARRGAQVGGETVVRIAATRVEGLVRADPATVAAQMALPADRILTGAEIRERVRALNAENKFERVDYRLEPAGTERVLVITPTEKPWGPHTLRLGGVASTNFRDENTFNLVAAHTLTDVDRWGGEWRNELQLGNASMLYTDLYQPLGPGSRWFALPRFFVRRGSADVFSGDQVVGRLQTTVFEGELHLGYSLPRYGYVALGRIWGRARTEALVAPVPQPDTRARLDRWSIGGFVDRLDSYAFPRRGALWAADYDRFDRSPDNPGGGHLFATNVLSAWTRQRYTLLLEAYTVRSTRPGAGYQLGGFLNLSGTPRGRLSGTRTQFLGLVGYREMSDLLGDLQVPVYFGASVEAGNSGSEPDALSAARLHHAGALFAALDTVAGPVYLGWGRTAGRAGAFYLFWGLFWGRF